MTTPILLAEAERLSATYGPVPAAVGSVDGTEDDFGDLLSEAATALGLPETEELPDHVWEGFQHNATDLATPGTDMLTWLLALRACTCEDCGKSIDPCASGLCDSCEGGRQYDAVSVTLPEGLAALDELLSHDRDLLVQDAEGGLIPEASYDALVALRDQLAGRDDPAVRELRARRAARGDADPLNRLRARNAAAVAAGAEPIVEQPAPARVAPEHLAAARTLREELDRKFDVLVDETASVNEASAVCRPLYDAVTLLLEGCERDA